MGDNEIFYLKLVKATLITIVMLGHHGRGTMGMFLGPNIGIIVHGAPSSEYISFLNCTIPKMKISTIKCHFFFIPLLKMC